MNKIASYVALFRSIYDINDRVILIYLLSNHYEILIAPHMLERR